MLHRAILGSIERFMGILIEHTEGKFPLWLNPLPVVVATITDESKEYAQNIIDELKKNNIRCELDDSNEKISYKVREHSLQKVPYIFTVGKKEMENDEVSVRTLGSEKTTNFKVKDIIEKIKHKIETKDRTFDL